MTEALNSYTIFSEKQRNTKEDVGVVTWDFNGEAKNSHRDRKADAWSTNTLMQQHKETRDTEKNF